MPRGALAILGVCFNFNSYNPVIPLAKHILRDGCACWGKKRCKGWGGAQVCALLPLLPPELWLGAGGTRGAALPGLVMDDEQ